VTAQALRKVCLSFAGAVEEFPFGPETSVFKVGGKMFALSGLERGPLQVSLKCEPDLADQLRLAHEAVNPGYHLNKCSLLDRNVYPIVDHRRKPGKG
jgi:predicted DNA-binding protein (MmcQ/YjbR family)